MNKNLIFIHIYFFNFCIMEPEVESIQHMVTHMSSTMIYNSLEVEMPELVKYCPYTGSYENMMTKAQKENNTDVYNALLKYKNDMIEREKKLEHLAKILIECPQKAN